MNVGHDAVRFRNGVAALAVVLLALGVGGACECGGCGEPGDDAGVDVGSPAVKNMEPTEAQRADKVVRSKTGRLVRVVGAEFDKDDAVTSGTDLGNVVEVQKVSLDRAICNVVIDARPVPGSELYPDGNEYVRNYPDIPALADAFRRSGCRPVMISGSCLPEPVGSCLWNTQLKGTDCADVADEPQFVCSGVQDCWSQSPEMKARLFRTKGECDDGKGGKQPCTVRWGDDRAVDGERVYIPHGWAGRDNDLNFRGVGGSGEFESR